MYEQQDKADKRRSEMQKFLKKYGYDVGRKDGIESRKKFAKETGFWNMCDFIINYEKYETKEDYEADNGGYDGEVYELLYLKGNGNYIVITECAE